MDPLKAREPSLASPPGIEETPEQRIARLEGRVRELEDGRRSLSRADYGGHLGAHGVTHADSPAGRHTAASGAPLSREVEQRQ